MTPILGTMLSIVLTDGRNFLMSFLSVISGAGCAIFIGYIMGLALPDSEIVKENNPQIASRVQPKLTDLVSALATGAVGAVALVRKDIAGTMPGVAIAISLVPPLNVAGLCMATGAFQDSAGAGLLWATNFASILVMGVFVMYCHRIEQKASRERARLRRTGILAIFGLLAFIAVPLTITSISLAQIRDVENCVTEKVDAWGAPHEWVTKVVVARGSAGTYNAEVTIAGPPPFPSQDDLPEKTGECNLESADVHFVPAWSFEL